MSIELKIKSKHLALEPAIIRKEEEKLLKQVAWAKRTYQVKDVYEHSDVSKIYGKWYSLQHHRKTVVRNESRATHLARAFIAGMPYKAVESKRENDFLFQTQILPRVFSMVAKYGKEPIHKKYNRDLKLLDYDKEDRERLTKAIEEWSKLD